MLNEENILLLVFWLSMQCLRVEDSVPNEPFHITQHVFL
jgi:hypothetical protein